jgi:hypothetical protein
LAGPHFIANVDIKHHGFGGLVLGQRADAIGDHRADLFLVRLGFSRGMGRFADFVFFCG